MEASVFEAPAGLTRNRVALGPPLLRLRSDEQLVALFRAGHDEAFRVIHDRYQKRLLAYVRQMLPRRADAEDALQEVFVRAYFGLRAHDRALSLRAWLFRVAHNRCIDELRRPTPPPPEIMELLRSTIQDPVVEAERRESLRRLIADVRRLPDQQRSALLMRELAGMSYADLAETLEVSLPAVKSLLVRARLGLAKAAEARDTACSEIREDLMEAHDNGVRPGALARRHMHDCSGCRGFRRELRTMSRDLSAIIPAAGPIAAIAKLLGASGGSGGGSAAVGTAASAGGTASSAGVAIGANHVAVLIAAAVATGGAVELQHTLAPALRGNHQAAPTAAKHPASTAPSAASTEAITTPGGQVVIVPTSAPATPAVTGATTSPKQTVGSQAGHPSSASGTEGGAGATLAGGSSSISQSSSQPASTSSGSSSTGSQPTAVLGGTGSVIGCGGTSAASSATETPSSCSTAPGASSSGSTGSSSSKDGSTSTSSPGSSSSSSSTSSSGSGSSPSSTSSPSSSTSSSSGATTSSGTGTK